MRVQNANFLPQLAAYNPHRLEQVGIVAHNNGNIIIISEAIIEQMGGQIYVGAFLFCFDVYFFLLPLAIDDLRLSFFT